MTIELIVSRHPAAIAFIAATMGGEVTDKGIMYEADPDLGHDGGYHLIPVMAVASADDVRGKVVAGNLPLHLAAAAKEVLAIEFAGDAPRGREYTADDMAAAGAKLVPYAVSSL